MVYRATVRAERFSFADLREVLAKANEPKSGDELAGIAASSARERVAAKLALADVALSELVERPLVDDGVTDLVRADHDAEAFASIASWCVGDLRERILEASFPAIWRAGLWRAITPEIAAAVAKIMGLKDLVVATAGLRRPTRCVSTIGEAGVLGVRIQPNHPNDDPEGIVLAALDGLRFGCGDAVIGVNPVQDGVESTATLLRTLRRLVEVLEVPTQTCVLAHVTTQLAALERGAPVDLLFQSVAGTEAANRSFGVTPALLAEGRAAVLDHHARRGDVPGRQVTYFETGQGSALSAEAHHGIDQLTLEARAQAVARAFDPFLVNSVVGFIGPEYLADARQIIRAGLEDHFVGKLMGLPMGVDVCFTNHVDADHDDNDALLVLLATAGCSYVMGVPAGDDVMLGYQSTSYHDAASVRDLLGLRPAPEFERWLTERGRWRDGRLVPPGPADPAALTADLRRALTP
ncbi:MAG: ethanolamine ammonia-lyase subunit EutB [Acidimicrobiales bacterium]